jgi:CBS-domain-containing membrane protein
VNDQDKGLNIIKNLNKKRVPHFGPLKGAAKWRKSEKHNSSDIKFNYNHPSSTSAKREQYLDKEREKIERILRNSKEEKKREKKGETVASKLRSLFIHKVILPR